MITFEIKKTSSETIIKFAANKVLTKGSYQYNNIDEAKDSPLAQQLFYLPFIKRIFISANFIAIERFSIVKWSDVENEVKEQLENYLNDGGVIVTEDKEPKKIPVEIYAESTPNPMVMKFVANKLLTDNTVEFKSIDNTTHSPLANQLFQFPFVKELFLSKNYISVTKNEAVEWDEIVVELRSFIKKYLAEGKKVIDEHTTNEHTKPSSITPELKTKNLDDISQEIISILDEYIKPSVTADGGNIAFKAYDKEAKIVHVVLQGACSGCPSSTITLKNGILNTLQHMLPGKINDVIAINQ